MSKVGSSAVQTNVRIVAATNLNMPKAIQQGKFREDLFYRLSTVVLPPTAREMVILLFRKFAADFAQKYKMPTVRLDEQAQQLLERQQWHGNIRQLRNVASIICVGTRSRIGVDTLSYTYPIMICVCLLLCHLRQIKGVILAQNVKFYTKCCLI